MNEKIVRAFASALHLDADEFIASLKEGENWLADDLLAAKITEKAKARLSEHKTEQLKRGHREILQKISAHAKALGFESSETGDAYLTSFSDWVKEQKVADPQTLSEEALAKITGVKALVEKAKKEAGVALEAQTKSLREQISGLEAKITLADLSKVVESTLAKAEINLDDEGEWTRERKLSTVVKLLPGNIRFHNGSVALMGENGEPETDEFGKAKDVSAAILSVNPFPKRVGKQTPPNPNQNPGGGAKKFNFKDPADFLKRHSEEKDYTVRAEMQKEFAETHK